MDYIKQLNAFSNLSAGTLSSNEVNVYLRLFWWNNRCCWTEWFETTDSRLQIETGIGSRNTLRDIRNSLRQKGFIDFMPGKKKKPTRYKIIDLSQKDEGIGAALRSISDHKPDHKPDHINKQEKESETKTKGKGFALSLTSYTKNEELLEALEGFVEMRKRIKAPLTERALSLLLSKLDSLAQDEATKIAIVNQSVENSWRGVFPLKQSTGGWVGRQGQGNAPPSSRAEGAGRAARQAVEAPQGPRLRDFTHVDPKAYAEELAQKNEELYERSGGDIYGIFGGSGTARES